MALTIRPLHPRFVAKVSGADMRVPPDAALSQAIAEAADTHAVPVFPGQHITDERHVAFARPFGRLETNFREPHRTTVMEPTAPMPELTRKMP